MSAAELADIEWEFGRKRIGSFAQAHTAILQAGYVHLPETASWLRDFEAEMLLFPRGSHDDQVDSVSQFLTWVTRPRSYPQIRRL